MKKTVLALGLFTFLSGAMAQAKNTAAPAPQSTWDKIKENISLSYYAEIYGRKFKDITDSNAEAIYSSVSIGYKVGKGRITLNPRFEINDTTTDTEGKHRPRAVMVNPRIGYSQLLYTSDSFSIFNSSRLEFGVNKARTRDNRLVKLKQYNAISFNLNKRNTLDIGVELYLWIYDGGKE